MIKEKIKNPIVSKNKKDPTQSHKSLNNTYRNIENRYNSIKLKIKNILDTFLTGRETVSNQSFIFRGGIIYQANSNYIYDISPRELETLLELIQGVADEYLLSGGSDDFWMYSVIQDEYRRGTHSAFTNLAYQSSYYAEQTTFTTLLSSTVYQNQIKQAFLLTFNDWKSLTEVAKSDLSNVLASAISRGVNPKETAKIISKRLDVSMSRAKALAQTEQLGAYRKAQWNETDWCNERLGLRTGLLHISAQLNTSRVSHVFWHGKVRTVEEVADWYEESGNRFNCHCSQIPVLLNEKGEMVNSFVVEQLKNERIKWGEERERDEHNNS